MNAGVSFVALFNQRQVTARLDQTREQTAGFELHDPGGNGSFRPAHEVIRETEIRDADRSRRSVFAGDVPRIGIHFEARAPLEVADDWTKLMISARGAD